MNTPATELPPLPAHVPPQLVGTFPLVLGATTLGNPFDDIIPQMLEGPEVVYAPTGYLGFGPAWIFRRSKVLQAVYLDTEHFSNKGYTPFAMLLGEDWVSIPTETDPPQHAAYRNLLNPLFTPRRMAQLDQHVRQFARDYIAKFKDRGHCEFMTEFAFRFPINVFLNLMDLPMDQVEQFLAWENGLMHEPDMTKVAEAVRSVKNYLLSEIKSRRENPRDDLISYCITAQIDGRKLTDDELFGFCWNLFIGGMDTVSTNTALQFRHLAENHEHQKMLRDNPALIPAAVEEMFRAYSAVTTFRVCIKPVEIAGVQIMPGDKVAMVTTLANRDPAEFDNPNEVRFDRNPRHVTFGTGIHRCVGAPLARRELIIAIEEFLAAIPEFSIAPNAKITTHLGGAIQPDCLPLVWKTVAEK